MNRAETLIGENYVTMRHALAKSPIERLPHPRGLRLPACACAHRECVRAPRAPRARARARDRRWLIF